MKLFAASKVSKIGYKKAHGIFTVQCRKISQGSRVVGKFHIIQMVQGELIQADQPCKQR